MPLDYRIINCTINNRNGLQVKKKELFKEDQSELVKIGVSRD